MPKKKIVTGQKLNPDVRRRARELRAAMTPAERLLWGELRGNKLAGWHFRRQQNIDRFVVDFYCHKAALVIEIDGPIHQKQKHTDSQRTKILSDHSLRVIRFTNQEIFNDLSQVIETILHALNASDHKKSL